jgi:hypothetical protein
VEDVEVDEDEEVDEEEEEELEEVEEVVDVVVPTHIPFKETGTMLAIVLGAMQFRP